MLERLFIRNPSTFVRNESMEAELNNKWGSLFDIFQNADIRGGIEANTSNAVLFDVVYSCVNILSDDVAKLPFKTYQKDEEGSITEIKDNDVHYLLRVRPNKYMTPYTFLKLMVTDMCIHGNFYALIEYGKDGRIAQLLPLTASTTYPFIEKGELYYQTVVDGKTRVLYDDEVIHVKAMSLDGIVGMPPIQAVRTQLESIDLAGRFNKKILENDARPQGILKVDGILSPDAKRKVRESWERTNSSEAIAVVDHAMSYQQIGVSQSDIQWLEGQKYNAQRVASIFKVPLHKINDLVHATYSNIEHQSLDYVKNTLQPMITQIEEEFGYKLYTKSDREQNKYVKFNLDSELRGDSEARAKVNEMNLRNGFVTINEVRASNEMSPFEGDFANEPYITLNYVQAENANMYQQNKFGMSMNNIDASAPKDNNDEEEKEPERG